MIKDLNSYIKNDTKHDIGKLEAYLREYEDNHKEDIENLRGYIEKSNTGCNKTFRWMIGIFITAFASLVMLVVMLCSF